MKTRMTRTANIVSKPGAAAAAALLAAAATPTLADFSYTDFTSTSGLNLIGSTQHVGAEVVLTESTAWNAGALWHATRQDVMSGFDTTFTYDIRNVTGTGADGLAFVIQNSGDSAIGGAGGALGYGNNFVYGGVGISNSLAIEFDLWDNTVGSDWDDMDSHHISLQTAGILPNDPSQRFSLASTSMAIMEEPDVMHTVRILYTADHTLSIFVDGNAAPKLTVPNLDLSSFLSLTEGTAFVGLTSATGSSGNTQSHVITSWDFTTIPAPGAATAIALGGLVALRRRRSS